MVHQGEVRSTYQAVKNYPVSSTGGFGINCKERVICGGGEVASRNVYKWQINQFVAINSLNIERAYSSSVYLPINIRNVDGVLIVAGGVGWGDHGEEARDTMEYLIMNDSFGSNEWRLCSDKLPCEVFGHQMNICQGKLILSGGEIRGQGITNQVWEGNISFEKELRIKWTPCTPMLERRLYHVSVAIGDKIFCIGGENSYTRRTKSTEYFSVTTNDWQKGPDLPFAISGAKCVVNKLTGQCFIVGGFRDDDKF